MWKSKDFVKHKQSLIEHINKKGFSIHIVNAYCVLVGLPLTVAYKFVIEELPLYTKQCEDKIQELNIFYGIKVQ